MGFGEYSHAAHVALTAARATPAQVFRESRAHPQLNPRDAVRECRDSTEHPESLAVVFALDVSGSMGDVPRTLATQTLPAFMRVLLDAGVRDPQLCFMAVGHAGHDQAPLQVGQFESTEGLIDQWLTRLWLEGGGVGRHEAYELAMLYAARCTRLDCVEKRGRRGYLFLTGDVAPNPAVSRSQAARLLGVELVTDLPVRDLIEELQQRFEPFMLLAPGSAPSVERAWRDLLGDRVVVLRETADAALVAAGLVALLEGSAGSLPAYIDRLSLTGLSRRDGARIAQALVPFAASIARDGAPPPKSTRVALPTGDRPSGLDR
jgi:hypothetical protein